MTAGSPPTLPHRQRIPPTPIPGPDDLQDLRTLARKHSIEDTASTSRLHSHAQTRAPSPKRTHPAQPQPTLKGTRLQPRQYQRHRPPSALPKAGVQAKPKRVNFLRTADSLKKPAEKSNPASSASCFQSQSDLLASKYIHREAKRTRKRANGPKYPTKSSKAGTLAEKYQGREDHRKGAPRRRTPA